MNEELFLKKFAKALGAEDTLTKIEQKKINEEKMLKGMAKLLGTEDILKELEEKKAKEKALAEEKQRREAELAKEKKRKEDDLLQMLNLSLGNLIANNEEHIPTIEKELIEIVPVAEHPDENIKDNMIVKVVSDSATPKQITFEDLQPQPKLPNEFISAIVKNITKNSPTLPSGDGKDIPDPFRRELDLIKKSIVDLHRFASRHSQHGGGGEVNLRYLDDIDSSTIANGLFLRYNAFKKKFEFAAASGSSSSLESLTDISVDNKVDGAVIQYSLLDDKYHIQPLTITTDMSASIDAGDF
jgi:hypothetical protein